LKQVRKIVWDGLDSQGRKVIDQAFPPGLRKSCNDAEMKITLNCGSVWQCVGSDNYDSLVGANPKGVVFTEYSLADPRAWDYVRPILAENGGWSLFVYTPRGNNHGRELYELAKQSDNWYCDRLTVEDTGAIKMEAVDEERRHGMSDEMIQQEFYCSFEGILEGSYFGREMSKAEDEGRITSVPYDPLMKVITSWDLGIGDATTIWFYQLHGKEIRAIDYYENSGEGLPHYAKVLQAKPYLYDTHIAPHDIEVRELGSGMSRIEIAKDLGIKFAVAPRISLEDGIEAVRGVLPRVWFDAEKCKAGINALRSYHKSWDDKRNTFLAKPYHDWSSHGADGFRYFAVANRKLGRTRSSEPLTMPGLGIA